jgi:predicted acyl esterase/lysophospholipase L1-like esterase
MRQTLLNRAAAILVVLICGVAIRGALSAAEPAGAPRPVRILLIGDSTVASYPKPPADRPDLTGWGQVFGEFFTDNVAILNHARSGASSKSFFQLGLWSKAIAERPDYVFIQFGHNDGPGKGDRSTDPKTEFRDNLRRYIDETRAAGAKPVLVTPVSRRTFKEGKIETTLEPYADAMLAVGQEKNVPVIDLHAASRALLNKLSDAGSADFSPSKDDRSHFSRKGALAMARLVAEAVPAAMPELKPYLKPVRADEEPPAATDETLFGSVTERHLMIPMRDGKRLSAYVYLPPGDGPWPVLYEQRYADVRGRGARERFARLAGRGYAVVIENFRGTHLSEGTWVGYRALGWGELQDGYDTVEWLAEQPWSTGKVGTFGGSQAGFAQNFLAIAGPPHLVCQYMTDTGLSLFHEGYRIGGTARPQRFLKMAAVCRNPDDNARLMEQWFAHPNYDDYWAQEDCSRHFDRMNVPCFTVGSWFDFMCVGSVQSYIGRQHQAGPQSRGRQQLLIGPWLHGGTKDANKTGELAFPDNARFLLDDHMVRWFDHFLKGVDNGVERDPAVRYYAMGAVGEPGAPGNVWRDAADWPLATTPTPYYLQPQGKLFLNEPTEAGALTEFTSDPQHPAEIPGVAFPGARDARAYEAQSQVRTFTTEPLEQPVEWTGLVRAELAVSSTSPDTDYIVRICDVYPDGRSILLVDSIRRARYREGFDRESFLQRDQVYNLSFDIGWISQIFNRGHRIRVTVASTGAPFYEPNPNTGLPLSITLPEQTQVAVNRVYHNPGHASRIIAPVMP